MYYEDCIFSIQWVFIKYLQNGFLKISIFAVKYKGRSSTKKGGSMDRVWKENRDTESNNLKRRYKKSSKGDE